MRKNIIVAAESHSFLLSMVLLLKRSGYNAIPAESTAELLKIAQFSDTALIILDLDLDGVSVLSSMTTHKEGQAVPIIAISSDRSSDSIARCAHLGCSAYLPKPLSGTELLMEVRRCFCSVVGTEKRKGSAALRALGI